MDTCVQITGELEEITVDEKNPIKSVNTVSVSKPRLWRCGVKEI